MKPFQDFEDIGYVVEYVGGSIYGETTIHLYRVYPRFITVTIEDK